METKIITPDPVAPPKNYVLTLSAQELVDVYRALQDYRYFHVYKEHGEQSREYYRYTAISKAVQDVVAAAETELAQCRTSR